MMVSMLFLPAMNDFYAAALAEGFARPGAPAHQRQLRRGGRLGACIIVTTTRAGGRPCPADPRPTSDRHGARGVNYHHEVFARMGYEAQAATIQDRYLRATRRAPFAAVPTAMVEDVALIGPWAKIADEIQLWRQTVLHHLLGQHRRAPPEHGSTWPAADRPRGPACAASGRGWPTLVSCCPDQAPV